MVLELAEEENKSVPFLRGEKKGNDELLTAGVASQLQILYSSRLSSRAVVDFQTKSIVQDQSNHVIFLAHDSH